MSEDSLRLAFAGTPELAATVLSNLINDKKHEIAFIITQPDRPAGRGRKTVKGPVKRLAERYELKIRQPVKSIDIDPDKDLGQTDVLVVAAFGLILPDELLHRPRLGCINVHTSLLPRWRGAAPIQRAIQAGDTKTGITIMQMAECLDTGDILLQKECAIMPDDTAGTLHDKLATLGGECLLEVLDGLSGNLITPRKQNNELVTYANKINKAAALIDWNNSALELERMIRAFNPVPVAHTVLNGVSMRIWQADIIGSGQRHYTPGTIINCDVDGIVIATTKSALRIKQLQLPGKKPIATKDFLNGHPEFLINY